MCRSPWVLLLAAALPAVAGPPQEAAYWEVRLVVGNYRRWRDAGLTATPHGAVEDRLGAQVVVTVGYRSW